ncbi:O(6)-methylguanine-induced apoptosis 2 [Podochytrium sp. JEL0797]|nr:O(6)-methylguanine-induced apoptosis 2 [Podochytrium sp. JEL0797]
MSTSAPSGGPAPLNFRSKDAKKQKHLKLFVHPPSIPTRFQTFHFDDNEEKGFNSTAPRFNGNLDELPGPGYYNRKDKSSEFALLDPTSLSNRGYGVGFASKTRRFKKPPTDLEIMPVGPAEYTTSTPRYSYSLDNSVSSNFRQRIVQVDEGRGRGKKGTPGPASYDTYDASKSLLQTRVQENGAAYVFKSKTRKSEINNPESTPGLHAPPPGAYTIPEEKNPRAGAMAAFKSSSRPGIKVQSAPTVGPGSYNIAQTPQLPIKKYKTVFSPFNTWLTRPPFFSRLRSKFQSVTQINHDLNLLRITAPLGPGQYEVARAADSIQKNTNVPHGVFVSTSKRFGYQKTSAPPPGEFG